MNYELFCHRPLKIISRTEYNYSNITQ